VWEGIAEGVGEEEKRSLKHKQAISGCLLKLFGASIDMFLR